MLGAMEKNYDLKLNINQWKIQASLKKIVVSGSGLRHLCCLMGTKFWKKIFVLNQRVCCANQRPFKRNCKVRITVFLNNETDLALAIRHFQTVPFVVCSSPIPLSLCLVSRLMLMTLPLLLTQFMPLWPLFRCILCTRRFGGEIEHG